MKLYGKKHREFEPGFWRPFSDNSDVDPGVQDLIQQERQSPVLVGRDLSLRAKILDSCGLSCTFCHNEGTPLAGDSLLVTDQGIALRGISKSPRVSVFSHTNGVDFIPGRMEPDDLLRDALNTMRESIGCNELHLTGGEPTLHPRLAEIVRMGKESGYIVKMTSNGERGDKTLEECAEAGLDKVNFSIFGTTPEELEAVQHPMFQKTNIAERKISALRQSIATAKENGVGIAANIVMSDTSHASRVMRLIEEYDPDLEIKILPDLDKGDLSLKAIYSLLLEMGATPHHTEVEAGSSNARVAYILPTGRTIYYKQTRPTRLEVCSDCQFNNPTDCFEGYYGVRLYIDQDDNYKAGVCIQRMDMTTDLHNFVSSGLADQVVNFREMEYRKLKALDADSSYGLTATEGVN